MSTQTTESAAKLLAQVAEDERLANGATPGPWEAYSRDISGRVDSDKSSGLGWDIDGPPEPRLRGQFANGHDAILIAASRAIVPTRAAQMRVLAQTMQSVIGFLRSDQYDYEARCDIASGALADCLAAAVKIGDADE